jgi:carboxyl-terminal processing protease
VEPDGDELLLRTRSARSYEHRVVLLVDGQTASAAELFAAALKFHGRAVVLGEKTFGKARAHRVIAEENAAEARTAATFVLPDGTALDGVGVLPDRKLAGNLEREALRCIAEAHR